jgi:hypothetical protein
MFFVRIPHDNPVGCPGPVISGYAFIVLICRSERKKTAPADWTGTVYPLKKGS